MKDRDGYYFYKELWVMAKEKPSVGAPFMAPITCGKGLQTLISTSGDVSHIGFDESNLYKGIIWSASSVTMLH